MLLKLLVFVVVVYCESQSTGVDVSLAAGAVGRWRDRRLIYTSSASMFVIVGRVVRYGRNGVAKDGKENKKKRQT